MINSVFPWRARAIASTALVLLVVPFRAHAYVDPGLGGQLFQAVYLVAIGAIGFVVAPLLLFGRTVVRIVRRVFRRRGIMSSAVPPPTPPNE